MSSLTSVLLFNIFQEFFAAAWWIAVLILVAGLGLFVYLRRSVFVNPPAQFVDSLTKIGVETILTVILIISFFKLMIDYLDYLFTFM